MAIKFDKFMVKLLESVIFWVIFSIIFAIIGGHFAYSLIDATPATEDDYKPLLEVQDSLVEDFNNVYSYPNIDIQVLEDTIVIPVENNECSIDIIFDKNTNYLRTERYDKVSTTSDMIPFIIYSVIATPVLATAVLVLLILGISRILHTIQSKKDRRTTNKISTHGDIYH